MEHDACIVHEHIELGKSDFHTRRERSDLRRICDIAPDSAELRCLFFTSSSTDSRRPVTLPRDQVRRIRARSKADAGGAFGDQDGATTENHKIPFGRFV